MTTIKKLLIFILLAFSIIINAQEKEFKGKIVDNQNKPLPGVTINIKGTSTGVVSNQDGEFVIKSESQKIIVFSYVGYATREISLSNETVLNVQLDEDTKNIDEVVVIGSRAEPRSRLETPSPIDVIDKKVFLNVPQVTLNQILNYVAPSFNSNTQTLSDGTDHIDPASLRGLDPDQVLVLINGKRRHTSSLINVNGTVGVGGAGTDLNAIPTASIKRIEILRDGAAAQYGSDAIAGVINIVLEDNTDQLRTSVTTGGYASKNAENGFDGEQTQANLNVGFKLGQNGGFINFSGSYDYRNPNNRQKEYTGTIYTDASGNDITDQVLAAKGQTRKDYISRIGQSKLQGGAFFFNSVLPFQNGNELYSFGGLNFRNGVSAAFRRRPSQTSQTNDTIYPNGFLPLINTINIDKSIAVGIRGEKSGWRFDISNTYGENDIDFTTSNTLNASLGSVSPTSFESGGYRFDQNTTNFDISKKHSFLSGFNTAFGFEHRFERYQIIGGEEASWEDYKRTIDGFDYYAGGAQGFPGFRPENEVNATRSSIGIYTDLELNITKQWLLAGALRFENYSDFGSTLNWKFNTLYKIGTDWVIRAGVNTGFRAPSLHQRYYSATSSVYYEGQIYQWGTYRNDSRLASLLGISKLKAEQSLNFSLGLTGKIGDFKLTVDGYYIKIDDRITYTGGFEGSSDASASDNDKEIYKILTENGTTYASFFANAINTTTKGIDVVLSYSTNVFRGVFRSDLSATFNKSTVDKVNTPALLAGNESSFFDRSARIYIESAQPQTKINLTLNYDINKWGILLRNVYFGKVDAAVNSEASFQTYGAKITTDLSLSYAFTKSIRTSIGANNLFDIYPDKNNAANTGAGYFLYSRDSQQFGFFGRYVFARIALTL